MKSRGNTGKQQAHPPDSLIGMVGFLLRQIVRSLPKRGLRMILVSLAVFCLIFFLNYHVIAVQNQGFGDGAVTAGRLVPWIWLFNFRENKAAFSLLSFLVPLLVSSVWSRVRHAGVKPFLKSLGRIPGWTATCLSEAGRRAFPVLLLSAGALFTLGLFTRNDGLYLTLAVTAFFAHVAQNQTLTFLFARAGWKDWQRLFRRKQPLREPNPGVAGMLPVGFLLSSIVLVLLPEPGLWLWSGLLALGCMTGGVLLLRAGKGHSAMLPILVLAGVQLTWYLLFGQVFADDAGRDELVTLGNYIRDPGGQMVLQGGFLPGGLGALGVWIGSMLEEIFGTMAVPAAAPVAGMPTSELQNQQEAPPLEIILIPLDMLGGPEDNPYTGFEGNNPCG